ncbi:putative Taurine catabolism dioxygenase TauD, TfdA family [Magnetofaba australis IT-1]|uniref:Putative Taurine catabolism dioxygenase TauD, TfdA family n=1 Tax=Magnetofaba australis IT-1 TaxID=1434232 RepID=A0A1Y2K3W4_9PROT|nr:putative Taurine catabolism dioxygenase TauD, TfdA family [Magnetofaba australis IT-1]
MGDDGAYQRWRDQKLARYPQPGELLVEVADPAHLSDAERGKILQLCARANMALVAVAQPERLGDVNPMPGMMAQLGVSDLDRNEAADDQGVSALTPGGASKAQFQDYIPYRASAIGWHTDGYYNPADRQVRGLTLYCQRQAPSGGENRLLDHEIAYILLRDKDPDFIRAFMDEEAMSIPPRMEGERIARPERVGPVFSVQPDGRLHMRYTARTKSISWKQDATLAAARAALTELMNSDTPWHAQTRLEAGQGLISNNPLHTRAAFAQSPEGSERILYRARYHQPVPVVE